MTKKTKTPGDVLQSFIDKYQTNPFALSKDVKLSYQTVLNIIKGKGKITVPTALRLGKYFGNSPSYWLDVQLSYEIDKLSANKKFVAMIKNIQKVKEPGKVKATAKAKPAKSKSKTLAEKRKKAAKVPGAKRGRGRGKRK
jgi:addiction module HigA family antidote